MLHAHRLASLCRALRAQVVQADRGGNDRGGNIVAFVDPRAVLNFPRTFLEHFAALVAYGIAALLFAGDLA